MKWLYNQIKLPESMKRKWLIIWGQLGTPDFVKEAWNLFTI